MGGGTGTEDNKLKRTSEVLRNIANISLGVAFLSVAILGTEGLFNKYHKIPKNTDNSFLNPREYRWEVAKNPKNFNHPETYLVSIKNPSEKYLAFKNPLTDKAEFMPYEKVWYNIESSTKAK